MSTVQLSLTFSIGLAALGIAFPLVAQEEDVVAVPKLVLRVESDYLALHARGTVPVGATLVEQRLTVAGLVQQMGSWKAVSVSAADGSFEFDVPLPDWRWVKLELRAQVGEGERMTRQATPKVRRFTLLTPERIAALPELQRHALQSYLERSHRRAEHQRGVLASECRELEMAASKPAAASRSDFKMGSDLDPSWYARPEAFDLADTVLSFQTPTGGWSKAIDYSAGPRLRGTQWTSNTSNPWHYCGTLDNGSTTEQIEFLARVFSASGREDARAGTVRGIEWLLAAQFPNGGWPQGYPVEPGYHEAITFNDGAMQHALELLQSVGRGEAPFAFVDNALRLRAASAFDRGIANLLACQVEVDAKPTVWCAQHDPISLEPVAARLKEPPSLSGGESAGLLKFLMREGPISPATITAVHAGIDWFAAHRISSLRKIKDAGGKTDYVADEASDEIYWARFYDLETGQPIFAGAQDGIIYDSFHEMAQHNKVAYSYLTTKPAELLGKELERWNKRLKKERP